jgi:[protein-PII] uridylyltransferase
MTEEIAHINKEFWDNFSSIYSDPIQTNNYLHRACSSVEDKIKRDFKLAGLHDNYSLYAIGGFGKKEMFPSSDIDISIIKKNKDVSKVSQLEAFIASMWDSGYKIGCSVRSMNELKKIIREDAKELTTYLTIRPLISDIEEYKKIQKIINQAWTKKKYFKAKSEEKLNRHISFDSSALSLEPDLKESPGAMRDFHNSEWILKYCFDLGSFDEIRLSDDFKEDFDSALISYEFIKTLRYATNICTKNKNRLNFESQIDIAKRAITKNLNYKDKVELVMKSFYSHVQNILSFNEMVSQIFTEQSSIGIKRKKGSFFVKNNQIGFLDLDLNTDNRGLIFDIFIELGKSKKINEINSQSISTLKRSNKLINNSFKKDRLISKKFIQILKSEQNLSSILRTMKNVGVLQSYIPDFAEIVGQMQFDLFHIFTVDEHTFKVVRNMRQMKINYSDEFRLENELIKKIPKIEILYIAGLFHDLGKGKGGNHSEIGAKISRDFAKRLGLSLADSDLISWLVLHHLKMSSISQRQDISDTKTISEFADIVLNTERLDYLYLLTVNDIRSTNPKLWNAWKHGLLKDLFLATRSFLNKEPIKTSKEISKDRQNFVYKLMKKDDQRSLQSIWSNFDDVFFNKHSSETLLWQSKLVLSSSKNDIKVSCRKCYDNYLEIFIHIDNADGLFLKLVEVLDNVGLEVIDANISTSIDKKIALNTFITKFHSHDNPLLKSEIDTITKKIIMNFDKFISSTNTSRIKVKQSAFKNMSRISNIEDIDRKKNLLTIEALNSTGLLIKIAKTFNEHGISIQSARINTLGEKVEDTFEVEDFTLSSVSQKKINKITSVLEKII